jgi:Mn-dependent DtxR family transcriptional regulator
MLRTINIQDTLEKLVEGQPGPAPSFTSTHLLELLLYLGREAPVGRKKLSLTLKIGEGVVRSMLSRLVKAKIVNVTNEGCMLTSKGLKIYKQISSILIEVGELDIEIPWDQPCNYAVVLKKRSHLVKKGLEQRDAAIRAGAEAALVMTYLDNELHMPGVSILSEERPDFASQIIEKIKPEENDVIIIAGAKEYKKAKYGALAAAQTLL